MSWTFQRVAVLCAGIAAVGTIPVAVLIGSVFGWQAGGISVLLGWFFLTPLLGLLANNVFVSGSGQPVVDRTPNHTQSATSSTQDDQSRQSNRSRESDTASDEQTQDEFDRTLERFLEADDHDPDGLLDR